MTWLQQNQKGSFSQEPFPKCLSARILTYFAGVKDHLCVLIVGINAQRSNPKSLPPQLPPQPLNPKKTGKNVLRANTPNLRSQGLWDGVWGDGEIFPFRTRGACQSNYWAASTAPADMLWQMVTNLADLSSWHPLILSTNAPRGQRAKPGLIYRAVLPYLPMSTQIFVERVLPGELLSIRLFPLPGLQERVTYRIVSTLCGTCVLYSITLSGWLSPIAWPVVKPHATKVAAALVEAAEQHMSGDSATNPAARKPHKIDIFGEVDNS